MAMPFPLRFTTAFGMLMLTIALVLQSHVYAQDDATQPDSLVDASSVYTSGVYEGRHKDHPNFKRYEAYIIEALQEFTEDYYKVTGHKIESVEGITLLLKDKLSVDQPKFLEGGITIDSPNNWKTIEVHINVNKYIGEPEFVKSLVKHEMVHAIQRYTVNNSTENWGQWPRWFKEGLAVFIAGEIAHKIETDGLLKLVEGISPEASFVGVENPVGKNYPEWALMLEYLDVKVKQGLIGNLIDENYKSIDLAASIKNVYGLEWDDFVKQGRRYTEERFDSVFPKGAVKEYQEAFDLKTKATKARDVEGLKKAKVKFESILNNKDYKDSPIPITCLYEIGTVQMVEGNLKTPKDFTQGRASFEKLLKDAPRSPQRYNAMFNLGSVYFLEGKLKEAKARFEAYLLKYPDTDQAKKSKSYLAMINKKLE